MINPKCPKCNKEIDELRNIASGSMAYDYYIMPDGELHIEQESNGFVDDGNVNEWWCPECEEVLFTSEEEAVKFLKNEDELGVLMRETNEREKLKIIEKELNEEIEKKQKGKTKK